jgi:signal transduction histidine kinase
VIPRHTPDEGGVIEFSVTDMGPGLPEEVINRLYEAFFSTKAEGMGIGLSLCRSIVESHRGRIKAQNIYNGASVAGCRFAFTLPVETTARHEETTLPPPPLAGISTRVSQALSTQPPSSAPAAPPAANSTP